MPIQPIARSFQCGDVVTFRRSDPRHNKDLKSRLGEQGVILSWVGDHKARVRFKGRVSFVIALKWLDVVHTYGSDWTKSLERADHPDQWFDEQGEG